MSLTTLLSLADSRLPAGGHVHSAGTEQAVDERLVHDVASLRSLLRRRLLTGGLTAAAFAVAAVDADTATLARLHAEFDARTPAPAARTASRAAGRGLARVGAVVWPGAVWQLLNEAGGRSPHHAITLGVAVTAGGGKAPDAALAAGYLTVTGPATAAQRLLGLDPMAVAAMTTSLMPEVEEVAARATATAGCDPADLPDEGDPLADLLSTRHAAREERLFAS